MVRYGLLITAFVLVSNTFASADDAADGWKTIYDGKSFAGWKKTENMDSWKIVDGNLQCSGDRSHLFYVGEDKPFKNFEFECECLTSSH